MNIKVKRKYGLEQRLLEDVIIHEKTIDHKNRIVIKAKRGELKSKTTDATLQLVLYDGNRYEEIIGKDYQEKLRLPHAKVHFEKYVMNIDLSTFNNIDLNEENYTSTFRMQKVNQLHLSIDSLEKDFKEQKRVFSDNFNKKHYKSQIKSVKIEDYKSDSLITINLLNIIQKNSKWRRRQSVNNAITDVKSILRSLENKKKNFLYLSKVNQSS